MEKQLIYKIGRFVIFYSIVTLLNQSCKTISNNKTIRLGEKQMTCREHWKYSTLKDTLIVRILMFNAKGASHMTYFPNFFIGITQRNDTVGLVDNLTSNKFEIGSTKTFVPYEYDDTLSNNQFKRTLTSRQDLIPVVRVYNNKKMDQLYCKIKDTYYCKVIE